MGVPLIQGKVTQVTFYEILEKIDHRLAVWKGQLFNRVGRICLSKSVLGSILVYNMQSSWLPQVVCERIGQATRSFIWNGNLGHRSLSLMS